MKRIVECVSNFSEGRRKEVVDQIVEAITSVSGIKVLDVEMDADHNRSVVTFLGRPQAVEDAAFRGVKKAAELIDMDKHEGEHPRIGAADVVPFVPIRGVTMQECVEMARRVGDRVGRELDIPVLFVREGSYQARESQPGQYSTRRVRGSQERDSNRAP
jgi:glutamate formiminotransferase